MRSFSYVALLFYAAFSCAACPVGYYDDGFGGCTNMDCPVGYTRPSIQDVCTLIPDPTPICTAPQYYDSLSNSCLTPQPCGAGFMPDPAFPAVCISIACPAGEIRTANGLCTPVPNCTGQQLYDISTNSCVSNNLCLPPMVVNAQNMCVDPSAPGNPGLPANPGLPSNSTVFVGSGTFVSNIVLDSIASSLSRSEQDSHLSSASLGVIASTLTSLSSQLSTADNYQNSLLSDLVDKSLARDANAKLDNIDTHLQAIANNTAKTCDPAVPVGYFGFSGLPGCAPSVSGSGIADGLLQDIKDNTSELTSHGRGIDNALQEITGILSHAFPAQTQNCTPVLDAEGNPTFDSVGNPIENCTMSSGAGTTPSHGIGSGGGSAGAFDLVSKQADLDAKKTQLQDKFGAIRDDMNAQFNLSVSGSASLPSFHLFDYKGDSIDVDFSRFSSAFSLIGNVLFLMAVLYSITIILGA